MRATWVVGDCSGEDKVDARVEKKKKKKPELSRMNDSRQMSHEYALGVDVGELDLHGRPKVCG